MPRAYAAALFAAALLVGACGGSPNGPGAPTGSPSTSGAVTSSVATPTVDRAAVARFGGAYSGLCTALRRAGRGDDPGAADAFMESAHTGLHELAASGSDRAVTGRLLEAKSRVERDLAAGMAVTENLDRLARATADAIAALGQRRPEPCTG